MHILVTGGTGFIGSALCPQLLRDGHELTLFTRQPDKVARVYGERVRSIRALTEFKEEWPLDAVINLAGEGIADRPWSAARKQQLHASRVPLTEELVNVLRRRAQKPSVMISASAVGWYGDQGDTVLEENAAAHDEYTHQLCNEWEQAAKGVEALGVRLCVIRTGVVLGKNGGMLKRLLPLFRLGLGGRLGSGKQWFSWIALGDYIDIVRAMLTEERFKGTYNMVAPHPVTNAEFTATLARALGRPAFLNMPAAILKLAMGEMSILLLGSQRVVPTRLLEEVHFRFHSRTIEEAFRNELGV